MNMKNVNVIEVLDVVDPPYYAEVLIEYEEDTIVYNAVAGAYREGPDWVYDPNSDIEDIKPL
jgi:hypothetical protein